MPSRTPFLSSHGLPVAWGQGCGSLITSSWTVWVFLMNHRIVEPRIGPHELRHLPPAALMADTRGDNAGLPHLDPDTLGLWGLFL